MYPANRNWDGSSLASRSVTAAFWVRQGAAIFRVIFRRSFKILVRSCTCMNRKNSTPNTGNTSTGMIHAILKLAFSRAFKI